MKMAWLALAALAAGAVALAADDDQTKKDLKSLAGTWEYTSQKVNGEETPKEKLKGMTVVITAAGKWDVKKDDKVLISGTVKLDPSKKPKAADWTVTSEDAKDTVALGIYDVEKDTFKHCWSTGKRPDKFESKEDSKVTYAVFKRAKK